MFRNVKRSWLRRWVSAARRLELLELDGPADDDEQLGRLEGLEEVVLGTQAHGLDRGLDGAVGGHDHDGEIGVVGLHAPDQLDAVDAGQAPVGEDQVDVLGLQRLDRRAPRWTRARPRSPRPRASAAAGA